MGHDWLTNIEKNETRYKTDVYKEIDLIRQFNPRRFEDFEGLALGDQKCFSCLANSVPI